MKLKCFVLLLLGFILLMSCKKEEKITAEHPPTIAFISDEGGYQNDNIISGAKGVTMTIRAQLNDAVGLKSFRFVYADWHLDNTIDLTAYYPDEVLTSYVMEFNFLIPADANESKAHEISLIITNLGELQTNSIVTVLLDGDYEAPEISNVFPGNNSTTPLENLAISFDVSDNISLEYVVMEFPAFNFIDSITSFNDPQFFSYHKNISGVSGESYTFHIRTSDHFNNTSEKTITYTIGTPGITHMFLVDKSTQAELDLGFIGTSLRMEPTANEDEHTIVYYNAAENTEIRFMENPYSFADANFEFGVDGENLVEDGHNSPLILTNKGYYTITINTEDLSFAQTGPVAPGELLDAIEVPSPPWLYGRGVDDNHGGWDTYSEYMDVDPENEYLFHIETSLGDAEFDGYCEGCVGFELNGSSAWDHEYIWDDICWFGMQWFQDGIIDDIDENGGKPEGWAGLAGELETWSDEEENYWNTWADMTATYRVTLDMYTHKIRIFKIN